MLLTAWLFISIFCFSYSAHVVGRIDLEAQGSASSRADIAVQTVEQITAGVIRVANIRHALAQSAINVSGKGDAPGASAIFSHIQHVVSSGFMGLYHISIIRNDGSLFWSSNSDLYERHSREISNALPPDELMRTAQIFESLGPIGGRDTLKISRMANTNSGEHFGVIISLFDKAHLADALRAMNVGPGAGALVMMRDGTIIAHSDPPGEITTSRLPPGNALTPALAQAPSGQFQIEESLYDGQPKLVAYRSLPDSPIVVAVAIDPAAELPGKATLRPLLMASAVGLSILALACISLVAVWHGRRRDQAALDAARRDREKAWEQLFHAQKAEALGRLAGGVAHDVNNVLQAVLGGAKAIKRRVPDPDIQRISNLIVEASERGASVTRRLLTLARRGELRLGPIDLGHVLLGLDEVLTHTLGADLLVRVEAPPALPPILADKAQLETVLVNLSINARDAMASRSDGRLTLSAALETIGPQKAAELGLKLGKYVAISVVDTGTGMDADTLRRATEPFFTTKPSGQGTGLGLAMAKAFAEQSGGAFRIVSEPGLGTTVTLLMPCAAIQAIPSMPANNEAPSDASEPKNSKLRRRALLVDDDSCVRQTLAGSLSDHGWSVDSVGSGAEALPVLERTEAIDLLVTDLAMPGMNGLDLIREARERRPGLPALLLTGYAGTAHAGLLGFAGAGGPFKLLRKPVRPEELFDAAEILVSPNGDGDLPPPERRP
jgi:signal transduction histidine kinase/CheY-like chemotaxis protein